MVRVAQDPRSKPSVMLPVVPEAPSGLMPGEHATIRVKTKWVVFKETAELAHVVPVGNTGETRIRAWPKPSRRRGAGYREDLL